MNDVVLQLEPAAEYDFPKAMEGRKLPQEIDWAVPSDRVAEVAEYFQNRGYVMTREFSHIKGRHFYNVTKIPADLAKRFNIQPCD
jgi:hypothetical protein